MQVPTGARGKRSCSPSRVWLGEGAGTLFPDLLGPQESRDLAGVGRLHRVDSWVGMETRYTREGSAQSTPGSSLNRDAFAKPVVLTDYLEVALAPNLGPTPPTPSPWAF